MMPRLLTHLSTILWGIGAVGTLVLHSMGLIADENLVGVFFVIICLYIFYSVVQNWQLSSRLDRIESGLIQNHNMINLIHTETRNNLSRIRLIDNPRDEMVWTGFTRDFFMFNPPLTLASDELLSLFSDNFRSTGLKRIRILLFEGVTPAEQERQRKRMERLHTLIKKAIAGGMEAEIYQKLQVRIVREHHIPESSYFMGHRLNEPVVILYAYPLVYGEQPHSGFEIHDTNTIALLTAEFNQKWNLGTLIPVSGEGTTS